MKRIAIILAAALALAGCNTLGQIASTGGLPAPSSIADRTKVDEQTGIMVTLAYTAAARATALAIQTGIVRDKATIARIGELDRRGYGAVVGVRAAYGAGNASDITAALIEANRATTALLSASKGN